MTYMDEWKSAGIGSCGTQRVKAPCTESFVGSGVRETARLILLLAGGHSYSEIGRRLSCTDRYISIWKQRFAQERLVGLASRYPWEPAPAPQCGDRGADLGTDTTRPQRWLDALEQLSAGQRSRSQSVDRQQSVAAIRAAATSLSLLHGE